MTAPRCIEDQWVFVPGSLIYQVSTAGRVRSVRHRSSNGHDIKGRELSPYVNHGQLAIKLGLNYRLNGKRSFNVYELILASFEGEYRDGRFVVFRDGNPSNIALGNVYYESLFDRMDRLLSDAGGACVEWDGPVASTGYGISHGDYIHRVSYERFSAEIPPKMQIDHLCRNRLCFNPSHLEAVSQRENILRGEGASAIHARKTRCIRGHEFDRTRRSKSGIGRVCSKCQVIRDRNYKKRPLTA